MYIEITDKLKITCNNLYNRSSYPEKEGIYFVEDEKEICHIAFVEEHMINCYPAPKGVILNVEIPNIAKDIFDSYSIKEVTTFNDIIHKKIIVLENLLMAMSKSNKKLLDDCDKVLKQYEKKESNKNSNSGINMKDVTSLVSVVLDSKNITNVIDKNNY